MNLNISFFLEILDESELYLHILISDGCFHENGMFIVSPAIDTSILEPGANPKEFQKNRARLIQKIYEVVPLCCPMWRGPMRVVAFIEDEETVKKIAKTVWCAPTGASSYQLSGSLYANFGSYFVCYKGQEDKERNH